MERHASSFRFEIIKVRKIMNRPIAILLLVLIIVGMLFSTFALFQGKFVEALLVYPLLIIATLFLSLGVILPTLLKPLHKLWMTLAVLLGWLMTRIILIILFYLVVTPIGLLARLSGKDFLNRTFNKDAHSYWIPRKTTPSDKKTYENQF